MATKPRDGALIYVDQQLEALKNQVPMALTQFDMTGIHQSRVATRRLKAAIDLLHPLIEQKSIKSLVKTGKKLRRRLGPLRDLDVMIEHLKEIKINPKHEPAMEWILNELESRRLKLRDQDAREGNNSEKLLSQFQCWWIARQQVAEHLDSIDTILANTLHNQFELFASTSDQLIAAKEQIDVHELRIIGKSLRYTFEIAQAQGMKIPKSIFKTFKAMQESLGIWHDYVVLTETMLARMSKTQIAHHNPELGASLLDLSRVFVIESGKSLNQFKSQWKRSGERIKSVLHDKAPIVHDVSKAIEWEQTTSESQRDRDPSVTETTSPAASDLKDAPTAS